MKKIIGIIVVLVVILAGAFFFVKSKKGAQTGSQTNTAAQSEKSGGNSAASAVKESLLSLLEKGTGIKCSVEDQSGKYTVVGKNSKVRIEGIAFVDPTAGNTDQKGTMINDGTWAYMWAGKQGIKFNIKDMETASATAGQQNNTNGSVSKESDWKDWAKEMQDSGAKYDCNPTVATDSDFTPPSDVKFQDFGEFIKGLQQLQNNAGTFDPSKFQMPN